ncbi:ANKYRIN REPEAT PROTEIN [Salix viminalis]|nr:ANKYRIN REPEAT PROTEIN [Salix viminalis]
MQEVAGERGGYLHGRGGIYLSFSIYTHLFFQWVFVILFIFGKPTSFTYTLVSFVYAALDSDDLLYLKEQMEAEEDAERLLRRTEKRAFAAFKKAASLADSSPASVPLSLRVEPKPKSGIRQQDLLKKVVEVKPKRLKASNSSDGKYSTLISSDRASDDKTKFEVNQEKKENILPAPSKPEGKTNVEHSVKNEVKENPVKSLLGLAYASSDEEED